MQSAGVDFPGSTSITSALNTERVLETQRGVLGGFVQSPTWRMSELTKSPHRVDAGLQDFIGRSTNILGDHRWMGKCPGQKLLDG